MLARIIKTIAAIGAVMVALSGCTGTFASGPETITRFDIHYTLASNGTVHVVKTIDYDFAGSTEKHGIDVFLASRFATEVPGEDRVYRYSNIAVSSPTGASTLYSTTLGNALQIRIGNQNAHVRGKQTYIVEYDIEGALNEISSSEGNLPDFFWNATGHYWDPELRGVNITVEGPAGIVAVRCFAGFEGSTEKCDEATAQGSTATFHSNTLSSRQGMTIGVSWPEGTFGSIAPILEPSLPAGASPVTSGSNDGPDPFWNPLHWGAGLAALVGVPLLFQLLVVARRRDRKFVGVTPGQIPASPTTAEVGTAQKDETIVVQYQPPKGLPVGAAGTVLNKKRKNSDITVTLIDLAVRGHLRIEEVEGGNRRKAKDYLLVATPERAEAKRAASRPGGPDAQELRPHEALLLGRLFGNYRTSVTLSSLTNTFAADMRAIVKALDTWIEHAGYFLDKVNSTHPLITWGFLLGMGGFFLASFFEGIGLLVAIGLFAGSVITSSFSSKAIRRSALGHAVYVQLAGFKEYIATAEADRIRFDEDEDVFSRYMPWAMVFGEAERWAKVFAELVAQGKVQTTPDWYVGTAGFHAGYLAGAVSSISNIGTAVGSFTSMATSSFTSTPGSSGGGGGGGGGSSGGGGGGGGGGSW